MKKHEETTEVWSEKNPRKWKAKKLFTVSNKTGKNNRVNKVAIIIP